MRFDIVTLFPEFVYLGTRFGVTGRAVESGKVSITTWNPRDFATDRYRTVDDRPYGGGPGMVMKVEPLREAIRSARAVDDDGAKVVYLSPQGRQFTQNWACELVDSARIILVCGRYEGVDERLIELEVDAELSIGDYVLSGGEPAAIVVIDAVSRLIPGVLGDQESAEQDSYMVGLLDCPHYTRPDEIEGLKVPEVLQSGNHREIERWRLKQSLGRTWMRRPDLILRESLSEPQRRLLDEFVREQEIRSQ